MSMSKARLEAFSDGVIAIIITIMVLELKVPHGTTLASLGSLAPTFFSYVLSFVNLGIYWNNHHHMLHASEKVNGAILWANLHLLFWLSLVPCVTGWMGENHYAPLTVAVYGSILFLARFAYYLLTEALVKTHGKGSLLDDAIGTDQKDVVSLMLYIVAIPLCLVSVTCSLALYIAAAGLWLVPDRRIASKIDA